MPKVIRKEVVFPDPIEKVWHALTDPQALAEWLMPNNFKPVAGHKFNFHIDPMGPMLGIVECEVVEVEPPRRLVYTWVMRPSKPDRPRHAPMTLTWTLEPVGSGTRLTLVQTGAEAMNWFFRLSMNMGWSRYLKKLMPLVLRNIRDGRFTPGAVPRKMRCYGTKTVPDGYAK